MKVGANRRLRFCEAAKPQRKFWGITAILDCFAFARNDEATWRMDALSADYYLAISHGASHPMKLNGVYETHIPVSDLARSVAFYRDIVGLVPAWSDAGRGLTFLWTSRKENGMLGLWQSDMKGSSPLRYDDFPTWHFAFSASPQDVLSSLDHLKSKGVQPLGFRGEPVEEPVVIGWMPSISVYFRDPDGHSVEYIAVLPEPGREAFGIGSYSSWLASA